MLKKLEHKPSIEPFDEMPEPSNDFIFLELYDHDGPYGWAVLDLRFKPFCYLHLEIERWNHRILKLLKKDWIFGKNIIRSFDCDMVVLTKAGNLSNQGSYKKLIELFGFPKPLECTISSQEI